MVNFSYICGAELDIVTTNTDIGGVPSLHIRSNMSDSAKFKGASLSLYIQTN